MRKPTVLLLAAVCLLALSLRLIGLRWGLPDATHYHSFHPDEITLAAAALNLDLFKGDLNPNFFNYGSLTIYLIYFASLFAQGIGWLDLSQGIEALAKLHLIGRLITALLGTGTVLLTYWLARSLYSKAVGLLAAFFLAVTPMHVMHSHFMAVDVPLTFFSTLALCLLLHALRTGSLKALLTAGFVSGLAVATKYSIALPLLIVLALVCFLPRDTNPESRVTNHESRGLAFAAALGAMVVGFLVGCPYALLSPAEFWGDPQKQQGVAYELFYHMRQGHGLVFEGTGKGHSYHLTFNLPAALGIPMLLLALAGFAEELGVLVFRCLAQRSTNTQTPKYLNTLLLLFFLAYFFPLGFAKVRFARYLMPVLQVLCLYAGSFILRTALRLTKAPSLGAYLLVAAVGFGVLHMAGYAIAIAALFTKPDVRVQAANWLKKNAPPRSTIAFSNALGDSPWFFSPALCPYNGGLKTKVGFEQWRRTAPYRFVFLPFDVRKLKEAQPDFFVVSEFEYFDPLRLNRPGVKPFFAYLKRHAIEVKRFKNEVRLFGIRFGPKILPHDLLYVNPEVRIYRLSGVRLYHSP